MYFILHYSIGNKSLILVQSTSYYMWQWWILYLQVPEGLVGESGIPLNKGNIHIAKTSPHSVFKAYLDLFERDFTLFLRSRSQEMVSGGHMVLTIIESYSKAASSGNQSCTIWELLGITLNDMVLEVQNPAMDLNHVLSAITLPPKAPIPNDLFFFAKTIPNDLLFLIIPTIYAYCVSITVVTNLCSSCIYITVIFGPKN